MASSGGEVVHGPLEPIAAQEPLERAHRMPRMRLVPRGHECLDLRLDECGGVERLLVTVALTRLTTTATAVPDQLQPRTSDAELAFVPLE